MSKCSAKWYLAAAAVSLLVPAFFALRKHRTTVKARRNTGAPRVRARRCRMEGRPSAIC